MLVYDLKTVGMRLYDIRKAKGLTQAELSEKADMSDRSYADIERGTVNMRIETVLKICNALNITPDELFTDKETNTDVEYEQMLLRMENCSQKERATACKLLSVYLDSINK